MICELLLFLFLLNLRDDEVLGLQDETALLQDDEVHQGILYRNVSFDWRNRYNFL